MKRVLVVVDYQKDFVDGSLGFLQSENIAPEIYSLVVKAAQNKDLVIFTKDTHYENYLSTREGKFLPVEHCIKGTGGHKLYGELEAFEETINKTKLGYISVEMSAGQMVEDVKLAVLGRKPVHFYGRTGGMVPTPQEILNKIMEIVGGAK